MINNFDNCLAFTLRPENDGQPLHDDAHDSGGNTAFGITLQTFQQYYGGSKTVEDLRNITKEQIANIYRHYWSGSHCDDLPKGVDLMVFDFGVNAGTGRSNRLLQIGLNNLTHSNLAVDGIIGKATMAAVAKADASALITELNLQQSAYYHRLNTFIYFGNGWLRRLRDKLTLAQEMTKI